jgi:hypothetical protein
MGLFKRKPKFYPEQGEANKKKMREIFNEVVEDGEGYQILRGGYSNSQIEGGIYIDTRVTTYMNYIIGYRKSDFSIVAVEVNKELTQFSEPFFIQIKEIKYTDYTPKHNLLCLMYKDKTYQGKKMYMFAFSFGDTDAKSPFMVPNIQQQEERDKFVEFLKKYNGCLS